MARRDDSGGSARRDPPTRQWVRGLHASVSGNAQAFGYSITVTVTYGVVSSVHHNPGRFELIGFAMAAVAAFSALNLLMARFSTNRGVEPDTERAVLIGTATDFGAVGASVGVAIGLTYLIGGWVIWVLAPFVSAIAYVLVQSVELAIGQKEADDEGP